MTAAGDNEGWSSADVHAVAVSAIEAAKAAEPAITALVQRAVEAHEGTMVRLERCIKPQQSLIDKILRDREPSDLDAGWAVERINDVLRYTAVLPPDPNQWALGTSVCLELVSAGYHHIRPRRGLKETGYKGRNERFEAPSGQRFELQIHTAETLQACDDTRDIYEAMRDPEISKETEFELQQRRDAVFASIPIPSGAPLI